MLRHVNRSLRGTLKVCTIAARFSEYLPYSMLEELHPDLTPEISCLRFFDRLALGWDIFSRPKLHFDGGKGDFSNHNVLLARLSIVFRNFARVRLQRGRSRHIIIASGLWFCD